MLTVRKICQSTLRLNRTSLDVPAQHRPIFGTPNPPKSAIKIPQTQLSLAVAQPIA